MTAPIIGLTTYGRHESDVVNYRFYDQFFFIPADYVDAVRRAGGVPMLLPPGEPNWQRWLDVVDGVIVIGGVDVDPALYGGDTEHPAVERLDPERDQSEIQLINLLAEEKERPVLCVCRGMQAVNVALGGTLVEHIPDIRETDIHRNDKGGWALESVNIEHGSQLAELLETYSVETYSGHHQAVKDVAPSLRVAAVAADGIVEAVELPDHPWLVAVQWHPEKSAETNPDQQRIFDALVSAAAARTNA